MARFTGVSYFAVITISGTPGASLAESRAMYTELLRKVGPRLLEHLPE
jgi:hypothetical protein